MKINPKIVLVFVILLIIVFLIYPKRDTKKEENLNENSLEEVKEPIKYFSPNTDKIVIETGTKILYSNDSGTTLDYYAIDNTGNNVLFREKDRAFVRILGVTYFFTNNTEIFHPEEDGIKNYTIFSGNISFSNPGVYLIKICLGENINLSSTGAPVWPWGCFEDDTSAEIRVYDRN